MPPAEGNASGGGDRSGCQCTCEPTSITCPFQVKGLPNITPRFFAVWLSCSLQPIRTLTGRGYGLGTNDKDFSFGSVLFQAVCMQPGQKHGGFHALDEGWEILFHIRHQDLGIISVLEGFRMLIDLQVTRWQAKAAHRSPRWCAAPTINRHWASAGGGHRLLISGIWKMPAA